METKKKTKRKVHTITSLQRELANERREIKALRLENEQLNAQLEALKIKPVKSDPEPDLFSKRGAPLGLPQGIRLHHDTVARKIPRAIWPKVKDMIEDFKAQLVQEHYLKRAESL